MVAAYFLALEWGEAGAVYNVCSGNVYTLRELLNRLIGLTHLEVEVVVESERLRLNDLPVLAGRFQALNLQTGWRPIIDLDTTLTDLLSHWRETVACA